MAFPVSPITGTQHTTAGGRTYEYTADGAWKDISSAGAAGSLDRANHTGVQAQSTVTSLVADLAARPVAATITAEIAAASVADRARANHTGTQPQATVDNLVADLAARPLATVVTANIAAASTTDRDRANHTGTQAQSTITNLTTDLALKADLVAGVVPAAQLPSYVDDILEYVNLAAFPATGLSNKIYLDQASNIIYRWTGTVYAPVSQSLALGTTSSSAARGDEGLTAYTHSQVITGNPHGTTKADLGLGNVDNTSDANKPASSAVTSALALKATIASPTLTGTPAAPTATAGDSSTQIATTAFVTTADNLKANIASPTFTGAPMAPTAAVGTSSTQLATTAFVVAELPAFTASATAPATPRVKDIWLDTDDSRLYMRVDDGTAFWMQINS